MLTIDPGTVCYLIIKAREYDAKVEPAIPDPGDNPTDDGEREVLFDYPDDPTVDEIRACIEGLAVDERAELLALMWIGAGDFDVDEWDAAVAAALDAPESRRPDAFLGIPLLADFLEEGLTALGYSCAEIETDRL